MGLFRVYYNPSLNGKPYDGEEAYRNDLFSYLDMCFSIVFAYRMQDGKGKWEFGLGEKVERGIPVTLEEAVQSLDFEGERWRKGEVRKEIQQELSLARGHMMSRLTFTPKLGAGFALAALRREFHLSNLEFFMLVFSLAICHDAKYEAMLEHLQGAGKRFPTLQLVFSFYELAGEISEEEKGKLIQQRGNLFEYLVQGDPAHQGRAESRAFALRKRVDAFLRGDRSLAPELQSMVTWYPEEEELPAPLIREREWNKTKAFMESYARSPGSCKILHLYGENGNGKRFLIRHGAKACGLGLLVADTSLMMGMTIAELDLMLQALKLECRLTGSVLCFSEDRYSLGEDEESGPHRSFPSELDYLLKKIAAEWNFCIWIAGEKSAYLTKYPLHFMALESPMLSVGERIILWNAYAQKYPLEEDVDLTLCANQYILTAAGIQEVLYTADMERASEGRPKICRNDLLAAVRQRASNQLGSYATLINAVFTWDDLIIDEEQKRQMQMICNQVKYRSVVGEEWGFHKKTPYGKGICAMFYGSPGTGKTMAVQVMANELGLDLYRIDLSQMVSKYIGETEKNISGLFRKAKNINALLFFDEADSLFAKRSEVKDSNDRNANAETAHLLQKLEDYSGITILATNYVNNIDDAFKRRIKFMINFVFPGEDVRYQLWTTIIPGKMQYEEEIDFEFFAKNFELSGSNIKEVLINASYIAASEGRGLANRDVVEAIRLNFAKYGKILVREDFGYLGF